MSRAFGFLASHPSYGLPLDWFGCVVHDFPQTLFYPGVSIAQRAVVRKDAPFIMWNGTGPVRPSRLGSAYRHRNSQCGRYQLGRRVQTFHVALLGYDWASLMREWPANP
jgi:hypothetical protein